MKIIEKKYTILTNFPLQDTERMIREKRRSGNKIAEQKSTSIKRTNLYNHKVTLVFEKK